MKVTMTVNGKSMSGDTEGRTLLSTFLREELEEAAQQKVYLMSGVSKEGLTEVLRALRAQIEQQLARFLRQPRGQIAIGFVACHSLAHFSGRMRDTI